MTKSLTLDLPKYFTNEKIINEDVVINFFKDIAEKYPNRTKVYISEAAIGDWLCETSANSYHTLFGHICKLLNCPVEKYYGKYVVVNYED